MDWNYKIIIFAFLAFVTIFGHTYIKRYEKAGPEMLSHHWSFYTSKTGKALIRQDVLYLFSSDKSNSVSIQQNIPSFVHGSILELSADMKCDKVSPGKKSWNLARLMLVQDNDHKDRWDVPYMVASFTGSKGWKRYMGFFIIGHDTKKIRISAQLSHCTGSFRLRNIHLFPVVQVRVYTWMKRTVLSSWAVFAVFLISSCFYYGKKKFILDIMLGLAFIAIIIGTTIPGDMKMQLMNAIKSQIHTLPWDLTKIGHFCFFALFGFILSMLIGIGSFIPVMLNIFLIAGGTEFAQFFIDGRTPLFMDFVIDSAGGLTGIFLIWLLWRLRTPVFRIKKREE